jgi:hypothetical protein
MTTRTQDEIRARFDAADDFFGFAAEVLADSMTADTIRQINPNAQLPEDWAPKSREQLETAAREYLTFAIEKALNHRGISAERSVVKLREFAWLLGRDDVVEAMDAADYPQYGVPKVKAFADGMGWPFLSFAEEYERAALFGMSNGDLCRDDCAEGCGQ